MRKLSPLEQWAANYRVSDIMCLMGRSVLKLNPEEGYACLVDGYKITVGQSPSEARRKARRILERFIKTPGSSKPAEILVGTADICKVAATVVKTFVATAYDSTGTESDYSNEVTYTVTPVRRTSNR